MRCLLAFALLLYCSISQGQTSVIIDVPSPISPCACSPCDCVPLVPTAVSVEVERTGLFARLRNRERNDGARSCIVRFIIKRRLPDPPTPVPPAPQSSSITLPPTKVSVTIPSPEISVTRHPPIIDVKGQ